MVKPFLHFIHLHPFPFVTTHSIVSDTHTNPPVGDPLTQNNQNQHLAEIRHLTIFH